MIIECIEFQNDVCASWEVLEFSTFYASILMLVAPFLVLKVIEIVSIFFKK